MREYNYNPNPFSNVEAERAVIGALVGGALGPKASPYILRLDASDFTHTEISKVFTAVAELARAKEHIDLVTVDAKLSALYGPEIQRHMASTIQALMDTPFPWEVGRYIDLMLECSTRRRIASLAEEMRSAISDGTQEPSAVLSDARIRMKEIQSGSHQWESMSDVLLAAFGNLEDRMSGNVQVIKTRIGLLDSLIGGIFPGELTVIGARPAVGKSAFAASIALSAARQGFKVGIVSREMTNIQYGQRILSEESGVDGMRIRRAAVDQDDLDQIVQSMAGASLLPIHFLFTVSTVEQLRVEVEKRMDAEGLDLLVIDYMQLLRSQRKHEADRLRVAHISHILKDMTVDLGIPVIALAQVGRINQMPTLANLRDSGDIEQDADGVIFLHEPLDREDPYIGTGHMEHYTWARSSDKRYLAVNVAKQRQGQTGFTNVIFDPAVMQYTAIDTTGQEEGP